MAYRDLREWIQRLEVEGELRRVKAEVDWNLELGAITRLVFDRGGPALLFEHIKGYQEGRCRKLFTGSLATHGRLSLMLGLSKDTPLKTLIDTSRQRFRSPLPPLLVEQGPVKEHILRGEEVNLYQFPVPLWHHLDGGRYINTLCGIVTRDPDSGLLNVGLYRGMIVDERRIANIVVANQHIGQHYAKYRQRGQAMPVAIAYGWDPSLGFLACAGVPSTVCEYDLMGGIRQAAVELVRCETSDLLVPASAEIVVEGSISPDPATYAPEGPFGEYTGYYGGGRSKKPVIAVTCITHRQDPIFQGTLEGMGPGHPNEDGCMTQISLSALVWNMLETCGVPGVRDVFMLPPSCTTNLAIQIHKTYRGQAKQVAMAVWGSGIPNWTCKNMIVVDDDIDIHDFHALEWALAYRVNPGENDLLVVPGTPGSGLDPAYRREERDSLKYGSGKANRLLIDATKNWEFEPREEWGGDRYPPLSFTLRPQELELIKGRWQEYGLD